MCSNAALAITSNCPALENQRNKQLPVVSPMNQATYLCNNAAYGTDPPKLGDLSPQGQMLNAQVCDSNCSYHPLFPEDPDSPMIPVKCYSARQLQDPMLPRPSQQYAVNGSAAAQAANSGPPAPYMGTGGNCQAFMIPQAPINLDQSKPPSVQESKPKPSGSPAPSPSPSPH
jgi:hypothetical protein